MSQKGPGVYSLDGQLGVRAVISDAINAYIFNGVSTVGVALGAVKRIVNLKGAEALGINASYDANNKVLVYNMIKEYFRLQPEGILYFMIVAENQTQTNMIQTHLPLLLKSSEIWDNERIGVVSLKRNITDEEYTPVLVGGYWKDAMDAIEAWPAANDSLEAQGIFTGTIIIDGSFSGPHGGYTSTHTLAAPGCVLCVAQDPYLASWITPQYNKYADTGAALGVFANRKACESPGAIQVENPPAKFRAAGKVSITEKLTNRWLTARLSNGGTLNTLTPAEIDTLNSKGVFYFDKVNNYPGVYGVNNGTCTETTSDFAWPERFNIAQKAKHLAYQFFVPLKDKVVNINDGKLTQELVAYYENEATNAVLGQLLFENNISEFKGVEGAGVFLPQDYNFITGEHETDPGQNTAPETLKIRIALPIRGILRNIEIFVGLKA